VSKFVAKFRKNNYNDDYSFEGKRKRKKDNKTDRKSNNHSYEDYSDFYDMTSFKRKEKRMY
jgi:prophage maintenance system killer protein